MIAEDTEIEIIKTSNSRINQMDFDNIPFGRIFSDHMFEMDYIDGAWTNKKITSFGPLSVSPAMSVLHYGQAIFEGMKAFRAKDGRVCLFRAMDNANRINYSARRMCMPEIPQELFMKAVTSLIAMDKDWVPSKSGTSLYVRPYMFATDSYVGVKASDTYKFIIFTCPVGQYYNQALKLKVEREYSRACPGGIGQTKAAGNYAGSLYPAKLAKQEGFDQLLWTDSTTHEYVEESGTMNVGFLIDGTFYTPPTTGTILKGITRNSVLTLLKDWGVPIAEERLKVSFIEDAFKAGKVQEAFGIGTAATIARVESISIDGNNYRIPLQDGSLAERLESGMKDIKRGIVEDKFDWLTWIE